MLYGCGALRHDPGPLLQAVTNDMLRRPAAYEQRDWVRILWAFGKLNYSPGEQLFNAFHRQVRALGVSRHGRLCSACVDFARLSLLPMFRQTARLTCLCVLVISRLWRSLAASFGACSHGMGPRAGPRAFLWLSGGAHPTRLVWRHGIAVCCRAMWHAVMGQL